MTYVAPIALLAIYFLIQYNSLTADSMRLHLRAIAESQANTLDLYLYERQVNLSNLVNDPNLRTEPASNEMQNYLSRLRRSSEAFVDLGYFDSNGVQTAYAGPYPSLEKQDYSGEVWYQRLTSGESHFIITDIYLGFRGRPHFTIAVRSQTGSESTVIRSTLDPQKIYDYLTSLEGSNEVTAAIVNSEGYNQLVTEHIGAVLEKLLVIPPREPATGTASARFNGDETMYAYSWLGNVDWALAVWPAQTRTASFLYDARFRIVAIAVAFVMVGFVVAMFRAKKLVELQMESDRTRAQLEHASKLATVGELAAGIAHEINNPLAAINEEAGLVKDLLDPSYGSDFDRADLAVHLDSIQESVFRCRDITHKLLGFVRKTEMEFRVHSVNRLLDDVVDGLLVPEMAVSNIEIERVYDESIPEFNTDGNGLQQVFLNVIKNAIDALHGEPGKISIRTELIGQTVRITISDTGCGMTSEQIERVFLPFFTTKEVGKGTGLGLSVSYGIIKSLGGKIEVSSSPGEGSTFTITLPLR